MTDQRQALTKSNKPVEGTIVISDQLYQVQLVRPKITQHSDSRPTHYQTAKSRGLPPPPVSLPKLPDILPLTLAAIIAISFLVAASMFSISLTAYSNSVDRIDRNRSFTHVE